MSDLMTIAEVAMRTRAPESTVRYWRTTGLGPPSFKIGRRVVFQRADVEAWVESHRNGDTRSVPA